MCSTARSNHSFSFFNIAFIITTSTTTVKYTLCDGCAVTCGYQNLHSASYLQLTRGDRVLIVKSFTQNYPLNSYKITHPLLALQSDLCSFVKSNILLLIKILKRDRKQKVL